MKMTGFEPAISRRQRGRLNAVPAQSFADRVRELVEKVDYRRADTSEEREEIYRLRYDAYRQEGAIEPRPWRSFSDHFDSADNAYVIGVYCDGGLASSIRLSVSTPDRPEIPALSVFGDILRPKIEEGKTIVDPTRFVVDPLIARAIPKINYATVRLVALACDHFNTDLALATVRVEHQAFYRRLFGSKPMSEARHYPSLTKPISLMGLDYKAAKDGVYRRYPFLRSTDSERRVLFERNERVAS